MPKSEARASVKWTPRGGRLSAAADHERDTASAELRSLKGRKAKIDSSTCLYRIEGADMVKGARGCADMAGEERMDCKGANNNKARVKDFSAV
jgi:hypothetical protein